MKVQQKIPGVICECDKCGLPNYPYKTEPQRMGVVKGAYLCERCGWNYSYFWR